MIADSPGGRAWVVGWAVLLRSLGPISVLYCTIALCYHQVPIYALCWAVPEAVFYTWSCIYLAHYLQRPAAHPLLTSKAARNMLFNHCLDSTQDHEQYLSKWFLNAPVTAIKRENIKEFFRWAFLNTGVIDSDYEDELESYVKRLEQRVGIEIPPGRSEVRCIRLTLDKVNALHRSLTWYMCIFVVDTLTHAYLRLHNFQFYRASISQSLTILPPRPHAFVASQRSPSIALSYWYRPHTSATKLPILFLHGIGVGLYPYMKFLKELNKGSWQEEDDKIGILAVEILAISSRLTTAILPKAEMCRQIRDILDHHQFRNFVLVSHSYGSVIATQLLKTVDLVPRISSIFLVDPISILLNQPDVAYNFTIRKPKYANEWLVWYFGSMDIGVAHTLSRTFFWSENILWKEDIRNHRCVVFLAENDSIISSSKVLSYLQKGLKTCLDKPYATQDQDRQSIESQLKVVWCDKLDHGQVFDLAHWRSRLIDDILREAERGSTVVGSTTGWQSRRGKQYQ